MEKAKIIKNGNVKLERIEFDSPANDYPTYDKMQGVIADAMKAIRLERDMMIVDRIRERVKTEEVISLELEAQRMFPRIKAVYDSTDQSEHWYWNDGSLTGLRLISFYPDNDFKINDGRYSMGFKVV